MMTDSIEHGFSYRKYQRNLKKKKKKKRAGGGLTLIDWGTEQHERNTRRMGLLEL